MVPQEKDDVDKHNNNPEKMKFQKIQFDLYQISPVLALLVDFGRPLYTQNDCVQIVMTIPNISQQIRVCQSRNLFQISPNFTRKNLHYECKACALFWL